MTQNQIAYFNAKETQRSHLANEQLGRDTLSETKRSNQVTEKERERSNRANESNAYLSAQAQKQRAEASFEQAAASRYATDASRYATEVNRLNTLSTLAARRAELTEQQRHNSAVESIQKTSAEKDIPLINAQTQTESSRKKLVDQQKETEIGKLYQMAADQRLKDAQARYQDTQNSLEPFKTAGGIVTGVLRSVGSLKSLGGGK